MRCLDRHRDEQRPVPDFGHAGADEDVVLVDAAGRPVACDGPSGGADAVAVELRGPAGAVTRYEGLP